MTQAMINEAAVARQLGLSRNTIARYRNSPGFPAAHVMPSGRRYYQAHEIESWAKSVREDVPDLLTVAGRDYLSPVKAAAFLDVDQVALPALVRVGVLAPPLDRAGVAYYAKDDLERVLREEQRRA